MIGGARDMEQPFYPGPGPFLRQIAVLIQNSRKKITADNRSPVTTLVDLLPSRYFHTRGITMKGVTIAAAIAISPRRSIRSSIVYKLID